MFLTARGRARDLEPGDFALVGWTETAREGNLDTANAGIVEMHSQVYRLRPEADGSSTPTRRICSPSPWRAIRCPNRSTQARQG
jgi:hypothetical protein